jgi:hypothetical protein
VQSADEKRALDVKACQDMYLDLQVPPSLHLDLCDAEVYEP